MKFSIRDLMWLTFVVALAVTWWVDRQGFDNRVKREADGYKALAETLADELKDQNPTAEITIRVNGREATISRRYASLP